jgi:hypothetical protein
MRALLVVALVAFLIFFGHTWLTKENLVVLVVGLLTGVGLLRILTHESRCAAREVFPSLTEMAEGYYAFRTRLLELQSELQRARLEGGRPSGVERSSAEYQPANRSG